ncbi:MAG: T9SS type A sorting domain-containing protein [Bacteroidetes bacterium]|nr:T9SS type A sorting domain-containing protein [Bacteroidota bacterium]
MKIFLNSVIFFISTCITIYSQTDVTAPVKPSGFKSISYELHIDLIWEANTEGDLAGYKIYRYDGTDYRYYTSVVSGKNYISLFSGNVGVSGKYKLSAYDFAGNESLLTDSVMTLTSIMSDDEFLDMTQRATFRYFWDYSDPNSGLARERYPNDPACAIGGTGFGIMAMLVGIERNYISREQGIQRLLKILDFLINKADKFHGAFPHWINGTTGKVIPFGSNDNGGDIVETSYLIQGLLTARQYFNLDNLLEKSLRDKINYVWENVEWDWYQRSPYSDYLYWNWSPDFGWAVNVKVQGWNETLITYLLAIASPTHPIPAELYYDGFAGSPDYKNYNSYYGYRLYVGKSYAGPLFFTHYSFLGFDPHNYRDKFTNYFEHNRNAALVHKAYCTQNTLNFNGYGENCWGLTASYSIPGVGYSAHEPVFNDNGTIAPTAAISSIAYTPQESIEVIKHLYRTYKNKIWWDYGFKDAFNITYSSKGINGEWFSDGYLAIDQGPIIVMIENYRTQLLWNNFMKNPEIEAALFAMGFSRDTLTAVNDAEIVPEEYKLFDNYPNPFNFSTTIEYMIPSSASLTMLRNLRDNSVDNKVVGNETQRVKIMVYDILGREIATLLNMEQKPGKYKVLFDASSFGGDGLPSGVYIYKFQSGKFVQSKKMVLLK